MDVILKTECSDLNLINRGKVRDIYEIDDKLLIVTTDRISAFDVILPNGIPNKGYVLTKLSEFWFNMMKDIIDNHLITTNIDEMPEIVSKYKDILANRSMLVKKAKPVLIECVVRGYLSGSAWKEYKNNGSVCSIKLPSGLKESSRLEKPIFTPATKAEMGEHDENIPFEKMIDLVGEETAYTLKNYSLKVYERAAHYAEKKGIIIADTKMEFGYIDDKIILIDELLTPDSSRFWYIKDYREGYPAPSMDKQFVRDYLEKINWNKKPPAPKLPDDIVRKTSEKYLEIMDRLIN